MTLGVSICSQPPDTAGLSSSRGSGWGIGLAGAFTSTRMLPLVRVLAQRCSPRRGWQRGLLNIACPRLHNQIHGCRLTANECLTV